MMRSREFKGKHLVKCVENSNPTEVLAFGESGLEPQRSHQHVCGIWAWWCPVPRNTPTLDDHTHKEQAKGMRRPGLHSETVSVGRKVALTFRGRKKIFLGTKTCSRCQKEVSEGVWELRLEGQRAAAGCSARWSPRASVHWEGLFEAFLHVASRVAP